MMIIRPIERRDLSDLLTLAGKSGIGLTSLPQNEDTLSARIERALKTWQGELPPGEQCYLFVLEDSERQQVVGVSAIEVAVGLTEPWYSFRVGSQVHASKPLGVYKTVPTLFLSNDHTGHSELCTLFLDPDYRHGENGKLLSKVRFLFIAAFRERFARKLIAEMRGFSDENGRSPFWENVGNHFFSIEFAEADYLSGTGQKAFIAELMPKHPLYVDFLSQDAQQVIGEVHPHTVPARRLLEAEGLRYQGYVDIFDGGPTLEAEIDEIRAVKHSRLVKVVLDETPMRDDAPLLLVANENYQHYRALLMAADVYDDRLHMSAATAAALGVEQGSPVRVVALFTQERV
ncbi:Arginine N-succinyltransferase subunit beta [Serratia rubidaea]|uniref:Arginine N-succinyltransferase n=1 Tax=Serratia rubidaea TaxID=61652 RepID=A0A126VIE2_SERRU|nr:MULTISPECIES: arginine N-succinyltransferase [Serratia]AGB82913.1 arginine N-succinyltransferase [Serratia sp. FGI94]AML58091.1 Arginine N-succinyltransferase [Serratia rubidaea]MBD8452665.1 arginine N-succinyltransferase [Serratia rubidaea]MBH1928882.1 arginine N-succinyltransferase [Serratia rubidaea]MDC6118658.1 arginine N-succinyltransferase [Serratia rubidaea]